MTIPLLYVILYLNENLNYLEWSLIMSYEKIDTKYLSGKRKQIIEWDENTGNMRLVVTDSSGNVIKEVLHESKK